LFEESVAALLGAEKVPSAGSRGVDGLPHCPSNRIEARAATGRAARRIPATSGARRSLAAGILPPPRATRFPAPGPTTLKRHLRADAGNLLVPAYPA
jgi:hypothetical protein